MIDKVNRARLRELLAKATPGEWRAGRMDMISYTGDGQTAFKNVYVDDPRGGIHMGEQLPYTVARGEGDECLDNATLIVAAVNALPGLLDALDAAEKLCAVALEWQKCDYGHPQEFEADASLLDAIREYRAQIGVSK